MTDHIVADNRRADRQRLLLAAVIRFNNGLSSVECHVRDCNEDGARLALKAGVLIPPTFDLSIPKRGLLTKAETRWRQGDSIGVRFLKAELTPDQRIAQLEAENQVLRRRVAELANRLNAYGDSVEAS